VLIIEDDPDTCALMRSWLRDRAHTFEAYDGATGLELAVAHRPDLILLDLNLPFLHGHDVLRVLREVVPPLDADIVLVSSLPELLHEATREHPDVLGVEKPVDRAFLVDLVESI
jgi:DNA-binding response OmpR family regulator